MNVIKKTISSVSKLMLGKGLVFTYALIASCGLIAIKLGTPGGLLSFTNNSVEFHINAFVFVGIISYGISFLLYLVLISRYDLGHIVSLTASIVYLIVFVASFIIFGENFTPLKIAAICLILGGLLVMNSSSADSAKR